MKYLSLISIALLITAGFAPATATAQPAFPECAPVSTWNGDISNIPDDAVTQWPFICCTKYAATGNFLYHDGSTFAGDALPEDADCILGSSVPGGDLSWNDSYGLKGRGSISNPSGVFLDMEMFQTTLSNIDNVAQDFDNLVFTFNGGKFRFTTLYVDYNTTIVIGAGTEMEVDGQIKLLANSTLIIEPGASLKLLATADRQAFIDNAGGEIQGRITKEVVYSQPNSTAATDNNETLYSYYTLNPGGYAVNLHELATSFQDALDVEYVNGTVDKPNVQIGTWCHRDLAEEYGYFANHQYQSVDNTQALPEHEIGTNLLGSNTYVIADLNGDGTQDNIEYESAINHYHFNYFDGISIIPLYNNTDNTIADFMNDEDFLSLSNGAISGDVDYQNEIAVTPGEFAGPYIIAVSNANPNITEFKVTYSYTPQNSAELILKNQGFINNQVQISNPGETFTYFVDVDNYYNGTYEVMPLLETPLIPDSLFFCQDSVFQSSGSIVGCGGATVNYQAGDTVSVPSDTILSPHLYNADFGIGDNPTGLYRHIPMNGLNILANPTGSYWKLRDFAFWINFNEPKSALAFYDTRMLMPPMKEREYQVYANDGQSAITSIAQNVVDMPIVSNFMIVNEPSSSAPTEIVDIYNIPGAEVYSAKGDTILPTDAIAFNFANAADSRELFGQGLNTYWMSTIKASTQNPNVQTTLVESDYWSDPYDQSSIQRTQTRMFETSYNENVVTADNTIYTQDVNYWDNERNEFTLLALNGVTASDDTVRLAVIPLSFKEEYNANLLDPIETSVMPHPGFCLLNPNEDNGNNRFLGAYARGYDGPIDSLQIVVNYDYWGPEYTSFFLNAPIQQMPQMTPGNKCWKWMLGTTTPYGLGQRPEEPGFEWALPEPGTHNVFLSELVDNPNTPTSGNDEYFTGDIITLYPDPLVGDYNNDGQITTSDLLAFLGMYGTFPDGGGYWAGDFNGDNATGVADLIQFLQGFGLIAFGPDANAFGTPVYESSIKKRVEFLFKNRNVDHDVYDIGSYPGFTAQQQSWFNTAPRIGAEIFVTDELGWIVHRARFDEYTTGIKLASKVPTSAQLTADPSGPEVPGYPKGYKVYILWPYDVVIPGFTDPVRKLCLGCVNPDQPANLEDKVIFTGN